MSGKITVIGLGPGSVSQLTPEAADALHAADAVYGYGPYLDRVPAREGQRREASDNGQEIDRADRALTEAALGASAWRDLDLAIVPGITSMLAVAARVGAPLGHDFCALSLSNNLKPWTVVEHRLEAAASAGFVIALYNPISRARPWQLQRAFEILRALLPANTPVVFGHAVGRADERMLITVLEAADGSKADMATCIIVGSSETRILARPHGPALVYTPRSAGAFST
jgi:precorrin-3B C17-methyltransferase